MVSWVPVTMQMCCVRVGLYHTVSIPLKAHNLMGGQTSITIVAIKVLSVTEECESGQACLS